MLWLVSTSLHILNRDCGFSCCTDLKNAVAYLLVSSTSRSINKPFIYIETKKINQQDHLPNLHLFYFLHQMACHERPNYHEPTCLSPSNGAISSSFSRSLASNPKNSSSESSFLKDFSIEISIFRLYLL